MRFPKASCAWQCKSRLPTRITRQPGRCGASVGFGRTPLTIFWQFGNGRLRGSPVLAEPGYYLQAATNSEEQAELDQARTQTRHIGDFRKWKDYTRMGIRLSLKKKHRRTFSVR